MKRLDRLALVGHTLQDEKSVRLLEYLLGNKDGVNYARMERYLAHKTRGVMNYHLKKLMKANMVMVDTEYIKRLDTYVNFYKVTDYGKEMYNKLLEVDKRYFR